MISRSRELLPRVFFSSLIFLVVFILSGCNNDNDSSGTPSPDTQTPNSNQQPTAKITASLVSTAGKTVTLDGSSSSDPDGDALSFRWEQIEGPGVTLSGVSTATLSFVAPTVLQSTQFTFQLTVDDGDLSSTASVSFQLSPSGTNPDQPNQQPYAMITAPETATSGQTVTLNGSGSSDPDGDNLTYKWTQTQGPSIPFSNSSSSTLTFVAPTVSQSTKLTFQLTVADGALSSSASVNIQVTPRTTTNQQPSAKITAPLTAISGQTVTLDGSESSDPDNDTLSYQWAQTGGATITLSNKSSASLIFVAPSVAQPTQFSFQLNVNDGTLSNSTTVSVLISPTADNTSPSIVSRSPQPDQSGVAPTAEISVVFDEALLESSVDSQSLLVSQNGSPVPGVVSYDSANNTVKNKPASALSVDATYTVTLANTLKDISGNAFAGASWSFSTAADTVASDGVCATAEESNSMTLTCPSGEVITEVVFASYGNPGGECGSFTKGSCNANNSVEVVFDACKGRNVCTLYVGNESYGDPCENMVKKLAAQVTCGMATNPTTEPTPVPNQDADPENGPVLSKYSGPDCNDITDQKIITVAADGSGDHSKINDAVGAASGNEPTIIRIKPGTYKERVTIKKSNVTLCGQKGMAESTVITGNATGTSTSATVNITANDVAAENITIENTYGYGKQAVALMISSDRVQFRNCRVTGIQDTLYVRGGTQYFKDCYIEGRTDYIFGAATAVFDNCEIYSEQCGSAICAPNTSGGTEYGIVILGGKTTRNAEGAEMKPGCTNLARNWGAEGATTYIDTWLGDHINPTGWAGMHGEKVGSGARFGEYGTTGPGSDTSARDPSMKKMTAEDAAKFTIDNIFGSWTPSFSE